MSNSSAPAETSAIRSRRFAGFMLISAKAISSLPSSLARARIGRDRHLAHGRAGAQGRAIHVLDRSAWQAIAPGRHRAHEIGDGEVVLIGKIDRSDIAVVPVFLVGGLGQVAEPGKAV